LNPRASLVGRGPCFDPRAFPWARPIEDGWQVARVELDALLAEPGAIPPLFP
jgi:aspartyl/asparaginyl beta-hydroxylase (cupin superfamily)